MKKILTIIALMVVTLSAQAQNLKFGKPTDDELKMTVYAEDPEADAVELCRLVDVSYAYLNSGFKVFYRVKCRLKVLKPEGKRVADQTITYRISESSKSVREIVTGLKATAYNLEGDNVVKTKMESSMTNEEMLDKYQKVVKFSVPQVKVGTVIEYEYKLESDFYWDLYDWYAQSDVPVQYTRYDLAYPEWLQFNIEETGVNHIDRQVSKGNMNFGGGESVNTKVYVFEGRNLPALKDDGFVWHAADYGNKVTHELGGITIPGALYKNYTQTWEDIDRMLLSDSDFGGRLKKSSPFKTEIASSGILSISDKRERIAAVYQMLKNKVRWNGYYAFWGKPATKVLSEGTGTNADINFLLINMLQDAGIESFPVVLRNRTRGVLPLSHASLKYLTSFVVGVQDTDSTLLFIDGSVEDGYLNVLPPTLLVSRARVINKNGTGYWVNIQNGASGDETTVVEGSLNANGLMTCKKRRILLKETAASLRKEWRTAKDSMEMISKIQERDGIEVINYKLDGKTEFSPKVTETMEFTKQFDATGDKIYINPLVTAPMKESPFTDAARILPVEFPFVQSESVSVVINLPEGYQVEEMPKPFALKMNGLTVQVLGTVNGSRIQMRYKTTIEKTFYTQEEYQELKSFFDQLVEHANYMLVVKKGS